MKIHHSPSVLRAGICVLILLSPLVLSHSSPLSQASNPKPSDWLIAVQEDVRQREYHVAWQETPLVPGDSASYQAPNRAHGLRIGFYSTGVRIVPRATAQSSWMFGLTLTGLGQEGAIASLDLPTLSVHENRVTYQRDSLMEWYTNDESGLEQGFQIPNLNIQSPIILELALTGDLAPHLTGDGQAIEFTAADGTPILRYTSPRATDATGHQLPVRLSLSPGEEGQGEGEIRLSIDDSAATYPITLRARITAPPSSADWTGESDQDYAHLGYALSTAGDVNGDGYSDLIVGAPDYDGGQTGEGAVFVYYGSAAGLGLSLAWTAESDQENAHLGTSISIAGDVNGDGYADVIVGAPDYDGGQTDEGAAFVYHGSPTGLVAGPADWMATGAQENAHFGSSASTAGDVNGDGYSDVIVGAPNYDGDRTDGGAAFVYHGSSMGLGEGPADWTATGDQSAATFGAAVSVAGDVDGDGYSDVIIGAPAYDITGTVTLTDTGRVYVYLGGATGFITSTANWTAWGDQVGTDFGTSVSTAGDVNGDGYSDVIVGAPGHDIIDTVILTDTGAAVVYHGSSMGIRVGPADWMATGDQVYARFGAAVSIAGDVNSDGYADVIVGAPDYDGVQPDEGAAFAYHGGPTGLSAVPAWSAHPTDQADAHFGVAVATAGDVNGDGHSDLAIGATGYDHEHTDEGGAFVYHGSPSGLSTTSGWSATGERNGALIGWSVSTAGDVNGDGYADVIVGAPKYDHGQPEEGVAFLYVGGPDGPASSPDWIGEGDQDWAWFGHVVATAGDVNGDGYADVIIGAPHYDGEMLDDGKAFVYHGGPEGLTATPVWAAPPDGQSTAVFGTSARFGTAVSTAGDVNGDGYSDVIVTANGYDAEETNEGAAFVYHGGPTGLGADPAWGVHPTDQAHANFGRSASTAGDVNGDGYSDVIIGVPWYDNPLSGGSDEVYDGTAFVYHGSSTGLDPAPAWTFVDLYANSEFGIAVSTAGDVNGDGYSDVIIGAYKYTEIPWVTPWREGAVFVYHGSSLGLTSSLADWMAVGGREQAKFGISVSTAGDVNGDGYSDVIVGASNYADCGQSDCDQTQEGAAFVYHGSATGLITGTASWTAEGDQEKSGYGFTVATAGDVNGDGYSDVIVGAPAYNERWIDEGAAFIYLGNDGGGLPMQANQLRTDSTVPIAPLGRSNSASQVRLQLTARSPLGREAVALQWQLVPLGVPFTATSVISGISLAWNERIGAIRALTTGIVLSQTVGGLTADTVYRWRARTLYRPGNPLGQTGSRWLYLPWNGPQEADFRTAFAGD
ncbi:MAG: integrin alpha [Anaerolineae bacterium]